MNISDDLCYELYINWRLRACEHGAWVHRIIRFCSVNIYFIIIIIIIIMMVLDQQKIKNKSFIVLCKAEIDIYQNITSNLRSI